MALSLGMIHGTMTKIIANDAIKPVVDSLPRSRRIKD